MTSIMIEVHWMAYARKIETSTILLDLGMNVNIKNNTGKTVLEVANNRYTEIVLLLTPVSLSRICEIVRKLCRAIWDIIESKNNMILDTKTPRSSK